MSETAGARQFIVDALIDPDPLTINGKPVKAYKVAPPQIAAPCFVLEPHNPMLTQKSLTSFVYTADVSCIVPLTHGPSAFDTDLERMELMAEWVLRKFKQSGPAGAPLQGKYAQAEVGMVVVPVNVIIDIRSTE